VAEPACRDRLVKPHRPRLAAMLFAHKRATGKTEERTRANRAPAGLRERPAAGSRWQPWSRRRRLAGWPDGAATAGPV